MNPVKTSTKETPPTPSTPNESGETGSGPLVNEKQETGLAPERPGSDKPRPVSPADPRAVQVPVEEQLQREKENNVRLRQRLEVAEAKVARNHSSPESMRFRIFLEIINGFSAKGKLDMDELAKSRNPTNQQPEIRMITHAANLAEVAYQELEKHTLYGLV